MKKKASGRRRRNGRDTMRPEYDFSSAVRGVTAARYAQGANIAVIDPDVLDVFPDGATVNQTLRALAPFFAVNAAPLLSAKAPSKALQPTKRAFQNSRALHFDSRCWAARHLGRRPAHRRAAGRRIFGD